MDSLARTFLNYACDNLADTNYGLSGSNIVKFSNEYALKYNRKIPHGAYPFEAKNKRTALLENMLCFNAVEQFQIIKDLCELSSVSDRKETKQVLLKLYERCGQYADKGVVSTLSLPQSSDDALQTLLNDIDHNIKQNTPELVLDRLHTFSCKFIRQICCENCISVKDNKGDFYPLHSLIGMLAKKYAENKYFESDFVVTSLKMNISIFEKYNSIRNNQSYAHDNDVLNKMEAEFVVKTIANFLCFINKIEESRKKSLSVSENDGFSDIVVPF